MPYQPQEIVARYAAGALTHPDGRPLAPDARAAWSAVTGGRSGALGSARVRDSAQRRWSVSARRDPGPGRHLVVSPVQGDNEPFRAAADRCRPGTDLPISGDEWTLLALLAVDRADDEGRDDAVLREAAFRLVDRMVRAAQHLLLMGAADDD
jgi:hypothetical protein